MTFAAIAPNNYPLIALAEADRRAHAARTAQGITAEQRRSDRAEWAAIVEWCRWWDGDRQGAWPGSGLDECEHLAAVTLRTAAAALRKWHAEGRQPGEAEARAFLLLKLAVRFATYLGHPTPSVDADGNIIFPFSQPERIAA
ncbi:hypothetical protein FHR22_002584 [Sphingopyxis panaciterrae]|uniref:hypothetical protein n=1 Tax=Sphingopyxis panaciterrae TaxID=363841 RepID=UPI001423D658|nr:hypothetical protein [Sphingopyxis panaciterrae]NIJ37881.1 hypothetical protein [Sphingopyxis panaciterrae]